MVRCKFVCTYKRKTDYGVDLSFNAVYGGSKENEEFFKATPAGQFNMYTVNETAAEQFELGKEYYIDISLAE